jgi:hypothetical protein
MPLKTVVKKTSLCLLLATTGCIPLSAGLTPLGSVAGSTNATIGGQVPLPNTLIFPGETLKVADGAAVISLYNGIRLVFGQDTTGSFLQYRSELVVLLEQGSLSVYQRNGAGTVRVKAGEISVVPELGFQTLGQVAMLNGAVVVTSKTGMLRVDGNGSHVEVPQGRTITIRPRSGRAPQVAGSSGSHLPAVVPWVALGTGVLGTIVGFDSLHRANDARDTASQASQAASEAATAAASAASAAAAATQAASSATSLAAAAATLGVAAANIVGCDLNRFANSLGEPSPYTPPSGFACP